MPISDVNGVTLNYRFDGPPRGEVIIFSHSLASDLTMWDDQIPPLAKAGCRILRYDSRGHGRSSVPSGPYTIEMLTSDVVGLMDYLGLNQVHFCGISLGGMVGQMLGALHGNRLLSLTLCNTLSHIAQPKEMDEHIALVVNMGISWVAIVTGTQWFTEIGEELPVAFERTRDRIYGTFEEGYIGSALAIRDMDLREIIKDISVRTLIIVGEKDQETPVSVAEYIHEKIQSSVLEVIPNAGHFVNVQQTSIFNDILLEFLSGRTVSGGLGS